MSLSREEFALLSFQLVPSVWSSVKISQSRGKLLPIWEAREMEETPNLVKK